MKKIFIINGVGGSGKDTFEIYLNKYISTYKYSIVDICKKAARILGWSGSKGEKDRKFLSSIMDLSSEYNDMPFCEVAKLVNDFKSNRIKSEVLLIDMRDPKDIERAVREFGATSVLIRNPRIKKIKSNHADANVEKYRYDYIINNNSTLKQLNKTAKHFVNTVIKETTPYKHPKITQNGKNAVIIDCKKI